MAAAKLAEEDCPEPLSEKQIAVGLSGNLCRCTGYYKIIDAVRDALHLASADMARPDGKDVDDGPRTDTRARQ